VLATAEDAAAGRVTAELPLDAAANRTGSTWHVLVSGVPPGARYAWRVSGPSGASDRCDGTKLLLDPYAYAVDSRPLFAQPAAGGECWPPALGELPDAPFDWEGTSSPRRPLADCVVYECHVRGFTAHPSAATSAPRGTYAALAEKVPHLVACGFNTLQLLPVAEFNELESYAAAAPGGAGTRVNFWGYSTLAFFAPMARYAAPGASAARELKQLVRACHASGVEVILDVVFNHSAEGNEEGLTLSLRGLDNAAYYITAPEGQFYNYSGCGNTLQCNHPVVRRLILDCLRHWALEYRVDGFRFDLASILTRSAASWEAEAMFGAGGAGGVARGTPLEQPPLLELLSRDGVLRGLKLVAEAWDAGGLYQVGTFPHAHVWAEWNGRFRDAARQFVRGADGAAGEFAERLCGSPGLYGARGPAASLNFVTAHDGFSLADLVSFNGKRNEANGEGGRDGEEHNLSWNCGGAGDEGAAGARQPAVARLRRRQQRNLLAALFLAQGVPMVVMGDEAGHSKGGNNNTYCWDGPLNWLDWGAVGADAEGLTRFVAALAAFRARQPLLRLRAHPTGSQVAWHGAEAGAPDWAETSRLVAFSLAEGEGAPAALYAAFNASHLPVTLALPSAGAGRRWRLAMDTSLPPPFDMPAPDVAAELRAAAEAQHVSLGSNLYLLLDRSTLLLESVAD